MSVHKYIHPRNIYINQPNIELLVEKYPELKKTATLSITGNLQLNTKNEAALVHALLHNDFQLDVYLPPDKLMPTVALRLNYILWLEDIMTECCIETPSGIDIGCGASCIYSLLAARKNYWHMIGLETNIDSVNAARKNVNANKLTKFIQIIHQQPSDILSKLPEITKNQSIHFTMCNPPFYDSSTNNLDANRKFKNRTGNRPPPKTLQTGCTDELSIAGGECSFVQKMIDESIQHRQCIKVFTTMLGHKISMIRILRYLAEKQITNITQTQFCQGNTTRWAIAWSFVSRIFLRKVPNYGPPSTIVPKKYFSFTLPDSNFSDRCIDSELTNLEEILEKISLKLESLDTSTDVNCYTAKVFAFENTWSNQRRKRRQNQRECKDIDDCDLIDKNGKRKLDLNFNKEEKCIKKIKSNQDEIKYEYNYVYLVIEIRLQKNGKNICLELEYLSGTAKIDGAYQVYQYLINNWDKNCH